MTPLPPEFLAETARQIAFLAAVLGGFAATFLGTLLGLGSSRRVVGWAIAGAAMATALFTAATIAAVMLVLALHPGALRVGPSALVRGRVGMAASFLLGVYAMLFSLGLSGWARSRSAGWATTIAALLGASGATWAVLGFP